MLAKAYRLLTRLVGAERSGYLGLIRLAEQSGETRQLRDQVKELVERFPSDAEPQSDLAYLGERRTDPGAQSCRRHRPQPAPSGRAGAASELRAPFG